MTAPAKAHSLYRMFDADEQLLYVGCSGRLPARLDDHRSGRPWWGEVATVKVVHFTARHLALRAERVAIETEFPLYNAIPHRRAS